MKRPRVVLVDDLPEIIEYCSALLKADHDIVGTAQSGKGAIAVCEEVDPDVIVLDISMPSLSGIEAAKRLRSSGCRAAIVFLSGSCELLTAALEAGGSAYVSKTRAGSDLRLAITEALAGRIFVSESPPP